jgi:hypothetical protein
MAFFLALRELGYRVASLVTLVSGLGAGGGSSRLVPGGNRLAL